MSELSPERRLHALALLAWSASLGKGRSEMAGITRAEFERKQHYEQAGYGTPLKPNAPGVWWTYYDPEHGTTLVTNGKISDECDSCEDGKGCDEHGLASE
jgi:hypothetical protein